MFRYVELNSGVHNYFSMREVRNILPIFFLDNVFKMGDDLSATTFKRGDLRFSWNDGDDMSAAMLQEPWWPQWQLPVLLSVFALIGGLGLSLVVCSLCCDR